MQFRKKPVVVDAIQWMGDNWSDIVAFHCGDDVTTTSRSDGLSDLHIRTPEGVMIASPGDWMIRGIKGELYPCKPDIFEMIYEPVDA